MAFGLEIYDAAGVLILSSDSLLTRYAYHNYVGSGASGNANVDGIEPGNCIGFSVPRSFGTGVGHIITITSGNVAWAPPSGIASSDSDIYVVRFA